MRFWKHLLIVGVALALASPAAAQKKYDTGASETEIKVGNIMPYSGPASAYGTIGKTLGAYFNKVNAEGGIKLNTSATDFFPLEQMQMARFTAESFHPFGPVLNGDI